MAVARILALTVAVVAASLAESSEWSRFRGPNGTGVTDTSPLPMRFGPDENVVWKTALPPGRSSPVLTDERVFLTAIRDGRLETIAMDRGSGEVLWRQFAPSVTIVDVDQRNDAASPSPVVDESGVYVFFPDFGLLAYDLDGALLWEHPLGPFDNIYGMGASPILAEGKVLMICDQATGSYLLALDAKTGEELWKVDRPEAKSGHSTPVLYRNESGELEVIAPGSFLVTSYSVATGEKLWWVRGLSFEMKSTPVLAGNMLYINGYGAPENQPGANVQTGTFAEALEVADANADGRLGQEEADGHVRSWFGFVDLDADGALTDDEWDFYVAAVESRNGILGIRVGGEGDMTSESVVWSYHRRVPQLPSPLLFGDVLYMVNDGGIVTSLDASNGEMIAQGRLAGAVDSYYASPVAGDGKIFMASELGKIALLEPGGSLEVAAVNDLDDLVYATPAISDGRIYIRTRGALYCFGRDGS